MKDISAANFIIGMEIKRDRAYINPWLNHTKYIETILKHFNMHDCKLVNAPIPVVARIIFE